MITGEERHEQGNSFYCPTVVAGVTEQMLVAKEETFGHLAPVFKLSTEEEMEQRANDTEFGLAAYFFRRGYYPKLAGRRKARIRPGWG